MLPLTGYPTTLGIMKLVFNPIIIITTTTVCRWVYSCLPVPRQVRSAPSAVATTGRRLVIRVAQNGSGVRLEDEGGGGCEGAVDRLDWCWGKKLLM